LETPQDCAQVRHDMVERRRGHGVTERLSRIARKVVAEDRTRRAGCLVPMGQVRRRAFTGWNAGFPTICLANLPRDVDIPVKLTVRFKCARLRCEQSDTEPRAAERYSSRWPLFIAGRDQNSWGPAQIQRQSDDSTEQAYDESLAAPTWQPRLEWQCDHFVPVPWPVRVMRRLVRFRYFIRLEKPPRRCNGPL